MLHPVWGLARRQHGLVTRGQLLGLGYTDAAVVHRVAAGRLHPVHRGVYAVGRPELSIHGRWLAAVLSCGARAVLSHTSAAALWGIRPPARALEVSVPMDVFRRRPGVTVHRRAHMDATTHERIPLTSAVSTLIDIAPRLGQPALERAVNEATRLELTDPERLRAALDRTPPRPGIAALRTLLDRRTFALTDSELERRFLRLVRRAGLPKPRTGTHLNGFKVDFHWPELGLVVETDGLRYHRTPAQQQRDRVRDQTHQAAGLTPLRFTHGQVRHEPAQVADTLATVARRLAHRG